MLTFVDLRLLDTISTASTVLINMMLKTENRRQLKCSQFKKSGVDWNAQFQMVFYLNLKIS